MNAKTELPKCALCGAKCERSRTFADSTCCSNRECPCWKTWVTATEWTRLHARPARAPIPDLAAFAAAPEWEPAIAAGIKVWLANAHVSTGDRRFLIAVYNAMAERAPEMPRLAKEHVAELRDFLLQFDAECDCKTCGALPRAIRAALAALGYEVPG